LWGFNQQIPNQHPHQHYPPQQINNEDYHHQTSFHQPSLYPFTQFPTIPSQGESSSMPNLQNNPNEIENENQKYLLVTREMINQREQEKQKYNAIEYKPQELLNMKQLINNIQLDSGVQLNKSQIDQGFSLNSEEITGSVERVVNICVTPVVAHIKELSYCIYIEYNIDGNSERITNFVGTQEMGHDCKIQKFKTEGNIENIQFIVVWSENIFFGKDDVLYASRFNVKNEDFVHYGTIMLDINAVGKTKLEHDRKTIY
uniref:Galectin n=1 Tax=Meloidogyne floridensis TaxID=298350 RepID=A0A915P0Y0_9BILA